MNEILSQPLTVLLEQSKATSTVFTVAIFWLLAFLCLGTLLGRKLFQIGRKAAMKLEEENNRDTIRLENYRNEIDNQMKSPVLRDETFRSPFNRYI